ncbi:MAG TPA: Lrp/AsnC family transcriptional regulator [Chthoniobacterales bacterium]|jgi:DNA-binding Lrp family transcriptional regulator
MDSKLLTILAADAHASKEDIARQLQTTPQVVAERIAALEADGIILGYQAILDEERANTKNVTAVIEVRITPERGGGFNRLATRISQFDQVKSCYLMSGSYDLEVVVEGTDLREIAMFIAEKLATIEGVLSTATSFRLKTYKANGILAHTDQANGRLSVAP